MPAAANEEKPAYTDIDLTDTLRGLGVAEDTIKLLDEEDGNERDVCSGTCGRSR